MENKRISYYIGDAVIYKGELGDIVERSLFDGYTVKLDSGKVVTSVEYTELETAHAPL